MKKIAFLGNCQAETIFHAYKDYILPYTDDEIKYIPNYVGELHDNASFINGCDVIVTQKFDNTQEIDLSKFSVRGKVHYVPWISAVGIYWPYGGFAHPLNKTYIHNPPIDPYNAEKGDFYLNKLLDKNLPPHEIVDKYLNEDIHKAINLDRRLEMALGVIENRDKSCGYEIAKFIRDHFQKELLFSSPGHFRRSLSLLLINELFGRLDVEPRLIDRLNRLYPGNPHAGSDVTPIHPQVARHFGLEFIAENQRYRYYSDGRYTFSEYINRYVRFEFNENLDIVIMLYNKGRNEESILQFDKALQISPQSGYGLIHYSRALLAVNRPDEAISKAAQAAVLLHDDQDELPQTLEYLGELLINKGDLAGAESILRRAMTLLPNRPSLLRLLGTALEKQGRHQDACGILDMLCALDPLDYDTLAHLGHLHAAHGDLEASENAFSRSLAIRPSQAGSLGALRVPFKTFPPEPGGR
ncbi:WcbI family polysaccharide biosynthesis putative acetyltransferase [Acidibrevibacterium fodinaquatile]|uniref:WcbI family polysaccharide biosynthesis putative acetyltransferase n=1 Tax=Acidibrevibacterium fodinaquatile TaxID=1969806 RepID=UPI000E0DD3A7|nr:WcbI family polysaccharide biosynthesis putative acetyltransferase [Acidibrevibacterium fodinaquatile]